MKKTISITLESGQKITCPSQTLVGELLHEPTDPVTGLPYLGALVNNELVTFAYTLDIDSSVQDALESLDSLEHIDVADMLDEEQIARITIDAERVAVDAQAKAEEKLKEQQLKLEEMKAKQAEMQAKQAELKDKQLEMRVH